MVLAAARLWAAETPEGTLVQSYDVKPGGRLEIRADRGTMRIEGGPGDKAEIEVVRRVTRGSADEARRLLEKHEVRFSRDGDTIRVQAESKEKLRWSLGGPNLEVEIRVLVPRKFAVDAETAGGSVRATGLEGELGLRTSGGSMHFEDLSGTVTARTSGGSIKASKLTGTVDLATSGGSVTVDDARGERLKVRTSGGSLSLSGVGVPLDAVTSGGSIRLETTSSGPVVATTSGGSISAKLGAAPKGEVQLRTSGGSVEVVLPSDAAFDLDAATSAGSVRSEFSVPSAAGKKPGEARSDLRGPVNGGGPTVKLRTSAGGIRVRKG